MVKRRGESKPDWEKKQTENNNNVDELGIDVGKLSLANSWMDEGCGKSGFDREIIQVENWRFSIHHP